MANPFTILSEAIKNVPFVKYALGIAGIVGALIIIKSLNANENIFPLLPILIMLGLMVLLFLFSTMTTSNDKVLKIAGYILVYTVVLITCFSSILLIYNLFFNEQKPINQLGYQKKKDSTTISLTDTIKNKNNIIKGNYLSLPAKPKIDIKVIKSKYEVTNDSLKNRDYINVHLLSDI